MSYLLADTSIITINSKNRLNKDGQYSSSSLFDHYIELPIGNTYDRVCLLNAKIPHSYYQVLSNNKGLNTFILRVNGVDNIITVPIGNYTKTSIAVTMTKLLSNVIVNTTVTYPDSSTEPQTGKLTFNIPNPSLFNVSFIFDPFNSFYVNELLGVDFMTYNMSVITNIVFVSPNVIHTRIPSTIYLGSDLVNSYNSSYYLQEFDTGNQSFGDIVFNQTDVQGNSRTLTNANHRTFSFYLVDDNDIIIDLNGNDITFSLLFYRHNEESLFQIEQIKLDNIEKLNKTRDQVAENIEKLEKENRKKLKKGENIL